ncbi:MAG TPA: ribonuclease P protein component [Candidatus Saccharimonadales bacterium]|nr:ribonuclease P protein component [Candidatus Saccharimonadales bacterium]
MIGRSHRFHSRGSVRRLHRTGKTLRLGPLLVLRYAPNLQGASYRLAVVVSRKVSKSAVVRNRIRRRLYERVRILSSSFDKSYDLILIVYDESIAKLEAAKLDLQIKELFRNAKLTSNSSGPRAIVKTKE